MRLWVCCLWRCWSIHRVTQTPPITLSSQWVWPTRTCSTVSLFNTVCTEETYYIFMPVRVESKFKCSKMNYLHGRMLLGAYQWDGVNLFCWERKHQPAQMFHIPNLPFGRLPGKYNTYLLITAVLCNPSIIASTMLEFTIRHLMYFRMQANYSVLLLVYNSNMCRCEFLAML